jgi:acyl-coenzyme A synthetase/AMP-(fatty) acid ligase
VELTTSERRASGGEAPKLPAENLVKAFYAVVDRLGDDAAIIDEARDKELNWNELRDTVHRIAGGLAKLGVKKGDTVAIMLGNRWEFIPCDLAAVSLGAVRSRCTRPTPPSRSSTCCLTPRARS